MASKTVLLVDDDPVLRAALTSVLEGRFRVRTARNGSECLRIVGEEMPDVVVLDVMMDHLSEGFDVARALRADPATERLPIVMLTGVDRVYNLRMEVDESWVPADRYLEKPIAPDELIEVLSSVVGDAE